MTELEIKLNNLKIELKNCRTNKANASVYNDLKRYELLQKHEKTLLGEIKSMQNLIKERK